MGQTKIEWTERTWPGHTIFRFTEGNGRTRTRIYTRKRTDSPGAAERRKMRAQGLEWCRGCLAWLPATEVKPRRGACRACLNAEYRASYAKDGRAIRARARARKAGTEPLPVVGAEYLLDWFGGTCAYCPEPATTWDHIHPVVRCGETRPGNVVPACVSCNSSKKAEDVATWLTRTGRTPDNRLFDVIALMEAGR